MLRVETRLKAIKETQVRPKSSHVTQKQVHRTGEHTCLLSILMLAVEPHVASDMNCDRAHECKLRYF